MSDTLDNDVNIDSLQFETIALLRDMGLDNTSIGKLVQLNGRLVYNKPIEFLEEIILQNRVIYVKGSDTIMLENYTDANLAREWGQCRDLAATWIFQATLTALQDANDQINTTTGDMIVPYVAIGKSPQFFNQDGQQHVLCGVIRLNSDYQAVSSGVLFDPCFNIITPDDSNTSGYIIFDRVTFDGKNGFDEFRTDYHVQLGKCDLETNKVTVKGGAVLGLSRTGEVVYSLGFLNEGNTIKPILQMNTRDGLVLIDYNHGQISNLPEKLKRIIKEELDALQNGLNRISITIVDSIEHKSDNHLRMPSLFRNKQS